MESAQTDNKIYKIILSILSSLAVVLTVAILVVKITTPTKIPADSTGQLEETTSPLFGDMTKEDAVKALSAMYSESYWLPDGFIPDPLKLKDDESFRTLLYSYKDISEVAQIASNSVMGIRNDSIDNLPADDFLIDETNNYYTVISVDPSKVTCGELGSTMPSTICYRGVSFNQEHLNHYEEVNGSSHNDIIEFKDLSPEFAKLAMPIIVSTDATNRRSIYDYYFEDQDDAYILGLLCIGIGYDQKSLMAHTKDDMTMVINLYEMRFVLDKNTGTVSWEKDSNGNKMAIKKSFPISQDEASPS